MKEFLWQFVAFICSRPAVAEYLIQRAKRTPYRNLEGYMERDWLFNPYKGDKYEKQSWLPSIRIHHILRADLDQHHHDHPWDARTIILKGMYLEERVVGKPPFLRLAPVQTAIRMRGDTATLKFGEFHKITLVGAGGVYTIFITWKFEGMWGFLVGDKKIPYKDYLNGVRE